MIYNTSFPPWYPGTMAMVIHPGYLFYIFIVLAVVIVGWINIKSLNKANQYLTYLCTLVFVSEVSAKLAVLLGHSNHPFYHNLLPIQGIGYGLIFSYFLSNLRTRGNWFIYLGVLFALISAGISAVSYNGKFGFPSTNISLLSILMIFGSLYLYYRIILSPSEKSLFQLGSFWFATGNLFFYAGTFLIFGLYQWIVDKNAPLPIWVPNAIRVLNVIMYGSYLVSISLNAKEKNH
ncbi:hypothetical protein [Croceimicrobium hydrocarbonivorans]|uniref:Uncharacterized protein n=1 Tax=Croceimicrobium hydrocarbonivorans TaxID=2761580 RepID=A0A7H0VEM1_9FLAO|nr:hypothetical protein [Croceimicrobium hydrocarbonivorans]QNR24169.1 hypothetical protein H4K34_17635 [Croceimicrobium hydrocarbonivorans]